MRASRSGGWPGRGCLRPWPEPRPPARSRGRSATCASPSGPHGRGCSTSSSRAAGNAVPSMWSPRASARIAQRSRLRTADAVTPARRHPRAAGGGSASAARSGSRPGSSAGVKTSPLDDELDARRTRPAGRSIVRSSSASFTRPSPSATTRRRRRAAQAQPGVGGERVGRGELRQGADRLRAGALHEVGPEPLGDPRGGHALERGLQRGHVAARCGAEHVGVGRGRRPSAATRAAPRRPAPRRAGTARAGSGSAGGRRPSGGSTCRPAPSRNGPFRAAGRGRPPARARCR